MKSQDILCKEQTTLWDPPKCYTGAIPRSTNLTSSIVVICGIALLARAEHPFLAELL